MTELTAPEHALVHIAEVLTDTRLQDRLDAQQLLKHTTLDIARV